MHTPLLGAVDSFRLRRGCKVPWQTSKPTQGLGTSQEPSLELSVRQDDRGWYVAARGSNTRKKRWSVILGTIAIANDQNQYATPAHSEAHGNVYLLFESPLLNQFPLGPADSRFDDDIQRRVEFVRDAPY